MKHTITYPQYRKYMDDKRYFKIISTTEWQEIEKIGNIYIEHNFITKILPDRNFINDLTFDYENHWVKIGEEEYENSKKKIV